MASPAAGMLDAAPASSTPAAAMSRLRRVRFAVSHIAPGPASGLCRQHDRAPLLVSDLLCRLAAQIAGRPWHAMYCRKCWVV